MKKVLQRALLAIFVLSLVSTQAGDVYARSMSSSVVAPQQENPRSSRSIFSPFRQFFPSRSSRPQDKLISNVKIFPNPVADQINLSFRLDKQAEVSIKVMDALGNEVMTLLYQQFDSGDLSHYIEKKLMLLQCY